MRTLGLDFNAPTMHERATQRRYNNKNNNLWRHFRNNTCYYQFKMKQIE